MKARRPVDARRRRLLGAAALLPVVSSASAADHDDYPNKPIRLVVQFPPGGGADNLARAIMPKVSLALGRPIVIDNKPGAGGAVAVESVKNAKPDGWTVAVLNVASAANESLIRNKGYKLLDDLEPVGMYAYPTNILIVHPSVKAPVYAENRHEWACSLAYASWHISELDKIEYADYDYQVRNDLP